MHRTLKLKTDFAKVRLGTYIRKKIAAQTIAGMLFYGNTYAFAACEQEVASLCSSGDSRCLQDAAQSVAQAANDCKTPEVRQRNASLWQATPQFFDGQPNEHAFWRCVAQLCDVPRETIK